MKYYYNGKLVRTSKNEYKYGLYNPSKDKVTTCSKSSKLLVPACKSLLNIYARNYEFHKSNGEDEKAAQQLEFIKNTKIVVLEIIG